MKTLSIPHYLLIAAQLLLVSAAAMAQSFQNTLAGANADNYVAGAAVAGNYWAIGNSTSFAPAIGTEHIIFSQYSGATGLAIWDRIYYDNANKAVRWTATDLQAGYSQLVASASDSEHPVSCDTSLCSTAAPDVDAIKMPDAKKYFFVTGFFEDSQLGVRRMFVMKLNSFGNILWTRINTFSGGEAFNEEGVSVESCPNGDVIVVSKVKKTEYTYPAVTRFAGNGLLIWRFFYPPVAMGPQYNLIPRQSCAFREIINGTVNDPIGIAITGEFNEPGMAGTSFFVMRVAYNGAMEWKLNYPLITSSGATTNDTGWDIQFESESLGTANVSDNFIITGLTNAVATGPVDGAMGLVARVDVNTGAFVNGYRFGMPWSGPVPNTLMYGQGIYQSPSAPANVVITGGVDDEQNGIFSDSYLIELDVTNGSLQFAEHYPLTTPDYSRTESVVSAGAGYPTPGFFLSTNSFDTYGGGTLADAHVIKTDVTGQVNSVTCLSDTLKPIMDSVKANAFTRCTDQHCDTMIAKQLKKQVIMAPHVLCWSVTKENGDLTETVAASNVDLAIYPNPVSGTESATIEFVASQDADYLLEVLKLTGEKVMQMEKRYAAGTQSFILSMEGLQEGIYLVRVKGNNEVYTGRLVITR